MVPFVLFGYLLCNALLAWATLHKPYISKPRQTLSSPPTQNKNEWVHSVIFEPQLKIQVTQSTYKMTSFLDFQPFLKGFQSVNEYLRDLTEDINNPDYFQRIVSLFRTFQVTPLSNESTILKVRNMTYMEITIPIPKHLPQSEENFLDKFLKVMYRINPSLHKNLSCMKRVGILTWILGWVVYSNAQSISKIKDNLHTFQRQNKLQDKQIKHLANYLNLTMHQVSRHSEMLYEMDTKMFIMNKIIQDIMWSIDFLQYETDVIHYFQSRIFRVHSSLYAIRGDVDSLYEYMRAVASLELNPMIVPPDILKKILHKIIDDIKSNARLRLCKDPETNIWSYYGTVKLTPIVLQDYLMLILTVPLVDQSLQMNLYKVHNLPMLHPTLNVHAQYELEGTYLATLMEGMFISLPTTVDVKLCLVTNGHLCMFNQALYPIECTKWCVYALCINHKSRIRKDCFLKTLNRTTNLAYSLDGYLWPVSNLATEKLQI